MHLLNLGGMLILDTAQYLVHLPCRLMVTARVQAIQQDTATRSSQLGARTGSPALVTAPWMSSTPPLPSGQSACLSLWNSLPVYHSGTVCVSTTLGQPAGSLLWSSLPSNWSCVRLSMLLPVCVISASVSMCLCLLASRQTQSKHSNDIVWQAHSTPGLPT